MFNTIAFRSLQPSENRMDQTSRLSRKENREQGQFIKTLQ